MKSFVLAAVFSSALVFVLGNSEQDAVHQKVLKTEEEAAKYCNNFIPVNEDTRVKLERAVVRGETIVQDFHAQEWCNLNCNLEKLGFFDENGKMHLREIYESLLKKIPEFYQNRYKLLIHLYQTYRTTYDMEDVCERAYIAYYRFSESIMVATFVAEINANPATRDEVMEKMLTSDELPKELEAAVEKSFKNTEYFFDLSILDTTGASTRDDL